MFEIESAVYVKGIESNGKRGVKGIVKEFENEKYKVTFFQNDERKVDWFEENRLEPWKEINRNLTIKVKYHADIPELEMINEGNWVDMRSAEDIEMKQFEFELISLGVSMQLPKGYEAEVKPRSSTFKNFGILQVNSVGCIDESYCGDNDVWKMPVLAMRDTKINKGDRICQFRINKVMPLLNIVKVEKLNNEDRNGFGSTGVK